MDPTIREGRCFVTNQLCQCVHLQIVDSDGSRNNVPFSVDVYFTCCGGNDQRAAQLWKALSNVRTAGYTDTSFVSRICSDGEMLGFQTFLVQWRKASFIALGKSTPQGATVICRTKAPVWTGLADAAFTQGCPVVELPDGAEWLDERWTAFSVDARGRLSLRQPRQTQALLKWLELASGDPADFFLALAHSETAAGFELIRLGLL